MRVPSHIAAGRRSPFPAGVFIGNLGEVKTEWSEDQKNLSVILAFVENTPADEDSPQVGARVKMQRVSVIFDGQALVEIQEFTEDVPFALQNAATLVTQLAVALGVVTPAGDGTVEFDTEAFLEDLTADVYKGQTVVFEVRHRAYASRDAKAAAKLAGKKKAELDRIDDSIVRFQALANDGNTAALEAPVPVPEPTPAAPEPVKSEPTPPAPALRGLRKRN